MNILREILERHSVRNFKPVAIENDKLKRILEAGRLAPSAKNRQPWRFIVVKDKELKEKIKKAAFGQEYIVQAPVIVAACSTNIEYKMPNGQLSYPIDITFAASFMMLQAVHEGLGTCLITTFNEQLAKEILTVPHLMRVVMILAIGYAGEDMEPVTRKPIQKIISYNHW